MGGGRKDEEGRRRGERKKKMGGGREEGSSGDFVISASKAAQHHAYSCPNFATLSLSTKYFHVPCSLPRLFIILFCVLSFQGIDRHCARAAAKMPDDSDSLLQLHL